MTRRSPREIETRVSDLETRAGVDDDRVRVVVDGHGTDGVNPKALDDRDVFDCPDCGDDCILCMELIDR